MNAREIISKGLITACKEGLVKKINVSVSGGKDGLASLLWVKNNLTGVTIKVIHADCALEWNGLDKYISGICNLLKVECEIYRLNDEEFYKQKNKFIKRANGIGIPFFQRYCQHELKKPLFKKANDDITDVITVVGNRWGESVNRSKYTFWQLKNEKLFFNPLLDWSANRVYEYLFQNKIPLFWTYKFLPRMSCALCPLVFLRSKLPFDCIIAKKFPDRYNSFLYDEWFEAILRCKKEGWGGVLQENFKIFLENYNHFKKLKLTGTLQERKIKVYDFYD